MKSSELIAIEQTAAAFSLEIHKRSFALSGHLKSGQRHRLGPTGEIKEQLILRRRNLLGKELLQSLLYLGQVVWLDWTAKKFPA